MKKNNKIDFNNIDEFDEFDDIKTKYCDDIMTVSESLILFLNQINYRTDIFDNHYFYTDMSILIRNEKEWGYFMNVLKQTNTDMKWTDGMPLSYDDIESLEDEFDFNIKKDPVILYLLRRYDMLDSNQILFRNYSDRFKTNAIYCIEHHPIHLK
jgi:hypothetical protein